MAKRVFDMTDVSEAGTLGWITDPGFYKGVITDAKVYDGKDGRDDLLYVYMTVVTPKQGAVMVRDRKPLNAKSLPYLKAFAASVTPRPKGWSDSDLASKTWSPDFEADLPGKTVFFQYSPPEFDVDGKPVEGTYANFTYMRKEKWETQKRLAEQIAAEAEAAARVGGGGSIGGQGSYDFLNE